LAAARAIAELAQAETSEQVALAYGIESISFGPEYIIPKPFDPRLIARVAPARRPRRVLPVAQPLRLPLGRADAAAVYRGQEGAAAHRLRRGRGRARAARRSGGGGRGAGAPHADRPAAGDRAAPRAPRPARASR